MPEPLVLPVLRGPRVTLRPTELADATALFAIFSDAAVMRYWSTAPWTDPARGAELVESDRAALASGEAMRWAIADAADVVVGCVSLHRFHAQCRRAELGYLLGRRAWGRGYATEALRLALDHAFGPLGLHRIEADTDPRNTRSTALLERVGFTREGVLRERWIVDGEVSDTAYYGLLAREWAAVRDR